MCRHLLQRRSRFWRRGQSWHQRPYPVVFAPDRGNDPCEEISIVLYKKLLTVCHACDLGISIVSCDYPDHVIEIFLIWKKSRIWIELSYYRFSSSFFSLFERSSNLALSLAWSRFSSPAKPKPPRRRSSSTSARIGDGARREFPSPPPRRRGRQPFTVRPRSTSTNTLLPSIFLPSAYLYAASKDNDNLFGNIGQFIQPPILVLVFCRIKKMHTDLLYRNLIFIIQLYLRHKFYALEILKTFYHRDEIWRCINAAFTRPGYFTCTKIY